MKKIITLFAIAFLSVSLWAQSPQKISYQSVVRDGAGELIVSSAVDMQISVLQGAADGASVYTETQAPSTNENGLLSVQIGTGTTSDDFTSIDWANGPMFVKTEIDLDSDGTYDITATSELLSVPYALNSGNASQLSEEIMELLNKHEIGTVEILSGDAANPQTTTKSLRMVAKPDFTANKYSWDFGDGATITDTTDAGANHTYTSAGSYDVTLTAGSDVLSSSITEIDFVQIGDEVITDTEGNQYAGITLGTQTWLGGDLKTLTASDGSAIALATDTASWNAAAATTPIAAWENFDPATNNLVYNYHAAIIACPSGWHLPTMDEWEVLREFLRTNGYTWDGSTDEKKGAKAVASRVGWATGGSSVEGNVGYNLLANNATGLSLGPNVVFADGEFQWLTNRFGWFWTATTVSTTNAKIIFMYYAYSYIHTGLDKPFEFGYNIRCVKD